MSLRRNMATTHGVFGVAVGRSLDAHPPGSLDARQRPEKKACTPDCVVRITR